MDETDFDETDQDGFQCSECDYRTVSEREMIGHSMLHRCTDGDTNATINISRNSKYINKITFKGDAPFNLQSNCDLIEGDSKNIIIKYPGNSDLNVKSKPDFFKEDTFNGYSQVFDNEKMEIKLEEIKIEQDFNSFSSECEDKTLESEMKRPNVAVQNKTRTKLCAKKSIINKGDSSANEIFTNSTKESNGSNSEHNISNQSINTQKSSLIISSKKHINVENSKSYTRSHPYCHKTLKLPPKSWRERVALWSSSSKGNKSKLKNNLPRTNRIFKAKNVSVDKEMYVKDGIECVATPPTSLATPSNYIATPSTSIAFPTKDCSGNTPNGFTERVEYMNDDIKIEDIKIEDVATLPTSLATPSTSIEALSTSIAFPAEDVSENTINGCFEGVKYTKEDIKMEDIKIKQDVDLPVLLSVNDLNFQQPDTMAGDLVKGDLVISLTIHGNLKVVYYGFGYMIASTRRKSEKYIWMRCCYQKEFKCKARLQISKDEPFTVLDESMSDHNHMPKWDGEIEADAFMQKMIARAVGSTDSLVSIHASVMGEVPREVKIFMKEKIIYIINMFKARLKRNERYIYQNRHFKLDKILEKYDHKSPKEIINIIANTLKLD